MAVIDVRRFDVETTFGPSGVLEVADVHLPDESQLEVELADVVRTNALAVPARTRLKYRVLRHELRLLLSFLDDRPGNPLAMRVAEFRATAGHIKRFVTESFGLGMLTAAVQSHFGWQPQERSIANFDVLPTRLAGLYPASGVRPDLLFDFNEEPRRWRLAGEARGRSAVRPQGFISASQQQRLDQLVDWSGRNGLHRIAMTWAYTGADQVQVDLFNVQRPGHEVAELDDDLDAEGPVSGAQLLSGIRGRAETRAEAISDQLYESAPEPAVARPVFDRRVRGDWVTADLVYPSDLHMLLGILDRPLSPEHIRTIRRGRGGSPAARDQDPVQIAILQRILVVVARDSSVPPSWSEIISRLS